MDKELVVERSYLVAGKTTSSKYLVIGSWINFPVTWGARALVGNGQASEGGCTVCYGRPGRGRCVLI